MKFDDSEVWVDRDEEMNLLDDSLGVKKTKRTMEKRGEAPRRRKKRETSREGTKLINFTITLL
jgi:CO dehydrogenase nickel-insertion accessory protein CooC1